MSHHIPLICVPAEPTPDWIAAVDMNRNGVGRHTMGCHCGECAILAVLRAAPHIPPAEQPAPPAGALDAIRAAVATVPRDIQVFHFAAGSGPSTTARDQSGNTEFIARADVDAYADRIVSALNRAGPVPKAAPYFGVDLASPPADGPQPPADPEAEERKRFEAWATKRGLDLKTVPDGWGRPMYYHSHVDAIWFGWRYSAAERLTP